MASSALNEPRFAEQMRRYLNTKGALSLDVADDLLPVAVVFDPAAPELRLLRDERTWVGRNDTGAPGAGNVGFVRLENPAASKMLCVVERFVVLAGGAVAMSFYAGAQASVGVGAVGGASDQRPRDGRRYTASLLSGMDVRVGARASGVAVKAGFEGSMVVGVPYDSREDTVLPPGWSFEVEAIPINQQIICSFYFRVRGIEASES